jgi:NAD(P)H dehydrogenase (quinone)
MAKGLVIYYSRTGNTKQMAEIIAKAMNDAELPTECKSVADVRLDELLLADAIVVGSPTYYGHMAAQVKQMFDDAVSKHGKLDSKVGAAFSSSVNIGGGNETTIMGIIEAMLISGLIVQGDPDDRVINQCKRRGLRVAELTKKLFK